MRLEFLFGVWQVVVSTTFLPRQQFSDVSTYDEPISPLSGKPFILPSSGQMKDRQLLQGKVILVDWRTGRFFFLETCSSLPQLKVAGLPMSTRATWLKLGCCSSPKRCKLIDVPFDLIILAPWLHWSVGPKVGAAFRMSVKTHEDWLLHYRHIGSRRIFLEINSRIEHVSGIILKEWHCKTSRGWMSTV